MYFLCIKEANIKAIRCKTIGLHYHVVRLEVRRTSLLSEHCLPDLNARTARFYMSGQNSGRPSGAKWPNLNW